MAADLKATMMQGLAAARGTVSKDPVRIFSGDVAWLSVPLASDWFKPSLVQRCKPER